MKYSKLYHKLPTIRAVRRRARRIQKFFQKKAPKGFKVVCNLRDYNGVSIFKSRRWRNRMMFSNRTKKSLSEIYEAYLQQPQP